ncbi:CoxG family protein [Deinococcus sp. Marseille-Q6407]|uniref:CoxG family protein n=1 Tax=Deinococcus sp. Marseille-Q6407 TaxID=2969223 RepID=UPI0021C1ECE0|nr:SRPBCC domain-containing protein [Deinococcus sp. Marseille-Q6407]
MTRLEFAGDEQFPAAPALTAALLSDPVALGHCVPGVQQAEAAGNGEARLTVPLNWQRLRGEVPLALQVSRPGPANEYRIRLSGAALGHRAELLLTVTLGASDGQQTAVHWQASGTVSGPATLLGGPAIQREAERVTRLAVNNLRRELARRAAQQA